MASAAEQLAANLNFAAFAKADELKKRIWFTLGALLVYRLGTYVPLPGIDPNIWDQVFKSQAGGILGMFNMFAGAGSNAWRFRANSCRTSRHRSSAALTSVSPQLEALKKEGEAGRKVFNSTPLFMCAGRVPGLWHAVGSRGAGIVVAEPGCSRLSTSVTWSAAHVPDVARRADLLALHRQRHLAHHHNFLGASSRAPSAIAGTWSSAGGAMSTCSFWRSSSWPRRDRADRVRGSAPAPPADPVRSVKSA